ALRTAGRILRPAGRVGPRYRRRRRPPPGPPRGAARARRDLCGGPPQRVAQLAGLGDGGEPVDGRLCGVQGLSTEQIQRVGRIAEELLGRFGDPTDAATATLQRWFDMM